MPEYEDDLPLERLLRLLYQRDAQAYPQSLRIQHAKLMGGTAMPASLLPDTKRVHVEIEHRA